MGGRSGTRADRIGEHSAPPLELCAAKSRPAHEGHAPLHLDMAIRNFGPIKRASLSLRPLTIFIGPSNTGKSYAAMLAHSIISSGRGTARRRLSASAPGDGAGIHGGMHKNMLGMLLALAPDKARACPPGLASQLAESARRRLAARLENEMRVNFASTLQSLTRHRAGHFYVELKSGGVPILKYGSGGLTLKSNPAISLVFRSADVPDPPYLDVERVGGNEIRCRVSPALISQRAGAAAARRLCDMIEEELAPLMVPHLPPGGLYFPAGRTGILQAHRAISSGIIEGAPLGGIPGMRMPRLSGVISDFVLAVTSMHPIRGPYLKIGEEIERDMLGGRMDLTYPDRHGLPELVYRGRGGGVPMHRASSAISEIAPITLYLKHGMERGGMLAIEEPEAHLHPRSQVRLAGHLVRLVRTGVNVMITTHSGALLEALSQYVEVGPMPPEARRRAVGTDALHLSPSEVAAHLFAPDKSGGCIAKNIAVSAEDGIAQDEFVDADKILDDTNMRIVECRG